MWWYCITVTCHALHVIGHHDSMCVRAWELAASPGNITLSQTSSLHPLNCYFPLTACCSKTPRCNVRLEMILRSPGSAVFVLPAPAPASIPCSLHHLLHHQHHLWATRHVPRSLSSYQEQVLSYTTCSQHVITKIETKTKIIIIIIYTEGLEHYRNKNHHAFLFNFKWVTYCPVGCLYTTHPPTLIPLHTSDNILHDKDLGHWR